MLQGLKCVVAIIRPFKLDEVRRALALVGVQELTVTEAKGCGRQKGHIEIYRGAEYVEELFSVVKIEITLSSDQVETVTEVIRGAARTGRIGDGKIFVFSLEQAVHIRTSDMNAVASNLTESEGRS